MRLRYIVPVCLVVMVLLAACELPRQGGDVGDIDLPTLTADGSPGATPPPAGETPLPAVSSEDISLDVVPAAVAPPAEAIEPGKVLVRLTESAAIQARSAELGNDQVVSSGLASLDEILDEIGASELVPVIEEVANSVNQDLESFSAQAQEVSQLYAVTFPEGNSPVDVARRLRQDPTVEFAEPNYIAGITAEPLGFEPNDTYFANQWHMRTIGMPEAWDLATGNGVIVAIIDTGISFQASDLADTRRLQGYDFANNDDDPTDDQGHGTHVAGTVAQSTNNGRGVTGVAYNAQLLPVKVLGANGQGSYENIIKGITYAVNQGADVINMSLAGRSPSQALEDAVRYAHERGVVVVAAAGNSNGAVEYPAQYDNYVIAVGATGFDNIRAPYSNFGTSIDVVAPGGNLDVDLSGDSYADGVLQQTISSSGEGFSYRFFEGTSMASPHVAGVVALMREVAPNASPSQIQAALQQSALNLGAADQYGTGLIQAAAAIRAIAPEAQPADTPTPTQAVAQLPATNTPTPVPPTDTPTLVPQPATNTPTPAPVPVTDTPTSVPVPATNTPTPLPPTPTHTPAPAPSPMTPTFTPTPAPPGSGGELIVNGSFEDGIGWVFGDTPIRGGFNTVTIRSGSRSARTGATIGRDLFSFSSVWQRVTIPAEASSVTLRAYVYPVTQDTVGDSQFIMVLDSNFRVLETLTRELSNSRTWEERTYNLSRYSGQTVYIYFGVLNRGNGNLTALFVDDVSLTWSP